MTKSSAKIDILQFNDIHLKRSPEKIAVNVVPIPPQRQTPKVPVQQAVPLGVSDGGGELICLHLKCFHQHFFHEGGGGGGG